jgi:hypothetical protein
MWREGRTPLIIDSKFRRDSDDRLMKFAKISGRNPVLPALILAALMLAATGASPQTIISIDFPGALATTALAINDSGVITGIYGDNNKAAHFYVRSAKGKYTSFDIPGASPAAPGMGINKSGTIAGYDIDSNLVHHGFVRSAKGTITTFDAPGAGKLNNQGTFVSGIDNSGAVTGFYFDSNNKHHGYVRSAAGKITAFEVSGAGPKGTAPAGINSTGTIAGIWIDKKKVIHGFIRTSSGAITSFDVPSAKDTYGGVINTAGAIAGWYLDSATGLQDGFVRSTGGSFSTFSAPDAGPLGTVVLAINNSGVVTGPYTDSVGVEHSYVRAANGTITEFDPTGSTQTEAWGINAPGDVVGYWTDANTVVHGFLRTP